MQANKISTVENRKKKQEDQLLGKRLQPEVKADKPKKFNLPTTQDVETDPIGYYELPIHNNESMMDELKAAKKRLQKLKEQRIYNREKYQEAKFNLQYYKRLRQEGNLYRKIDALARLMEGDDQCCAILITSKGLAVGYNSDKPSAKNKKLNRDLFSYLLNKDHTQSDKLFGNLCYTKIKAGTERNNVREGNFDKDLSTIKTVLSPIREKIFPNILKLMLEDNINIGTGGKRRIEKASITSIITKYLVSAIKEHGTPEEANTRRPEIIAADSVHINRIKSWANKIARTFIDFVKVEEYLKGNQQENMPLIEALTQGIYYVNDAGGKNQMNSTVHAETRIMAYIKEYKFPITQKECGNYIGISKLSCESCYQDIAMARYFHARGTHGIIYQNRKSASIQGKANAFHYDKKGAQYSSSYINTLPDCSDSEVEIENYRSEQGIKKGQNKEEFIETSSSSSVNLAKSLSFVSPVSKPVSNNFRR